MPITLALSARIGCGVSWVILIIFVSDSSNALLSFCGWAPHAQIKAVKIMAVSCFMWFSNNMEPRVSAAISAYTKLIWGYRPRSNCPVIF